MSRGVRGIKAPAEEGSEWDGTILKLVLSFEMSLNIIGGRRRPGLTEGEHVWRFCGDAAWLAAHPAHRRCQSSDHSLLNNAKWQHLSPASEFRPASRLLATPVPFLIVLEHRNPHVPTSPRTHPTSLLPVFFFFGYSYLGSFSCFPPLSQSHCWPFSYV